MPPPTDRALRRVLRQAAWNALLFAAALAAVAAGGEAYFRLTRPFPAGQTLETLERFHAQAGRLLKPNLEVRWTNHLDFWTASRTNSLGFLDREPVSAERAAASCRIAFLGDSYVEAREVAIADKLHVRLEALAARELPALNVATSAFGFGGTGQIAQLPYYDEFARRLRPHLLALVFVHNDFMDNSPLLSALQKGLDPDRPPFAAGARNADGTIILRPPDPDWLEHALPRLPPQPKPWYARALKPLSRVSYFAKWLHMKAGVLSPPRDFDPQPAAWAELLGRRPGCEALLDNRLLIGKHGVNSLFQREDLPPFFEKELEFTAFALDRFKERTDRGGSRLVILSTHRMGGAGSPAFDRLQDMAEARGIPVIDHYDYILRKGADPNEMYWPHDGHWTPAGHQWAAEAVHEWLQANRDDCNGQAAPRGE